MNILYLENHAVFAQNVTRQFLAAHKVTVVPGLAAARSAFATGSYDLVLVDYDLDDGKGDIFVRGVSNHASGVSHHRCILARSGQRGACSRWRVRSVQQDGI